MSPMATTVSPLRRGVTASRRVGCGPPAHPIDDDVEGRGATQLVGEVAFSVRAAPSAERGDTFETSRAEAGAVKRARSPDARSGSSDHPPSPVDQDRLARDVP